MSQFLRAILKRIAECWYGNIKEKMCFFHIPKCGGASIDYAIRKHYPFSNVRVTSEASFKATNIMYQLNESEADEFEMVLQFRENLLVYFMSQNVPFISGHFSFSDKAYQHFSDTYKYITILRDPVKRWISQYFFDRYRTHGSSRRIDVDLPTFIYSKRGGSHGYQYVQMIGGLYPSDDYTSQQTIERAKENLHKFEIVGCLEHLEDFLDQFEHRFGVKLKVPKKNPNPKPQAYIQSMITKEIEEQIIEICQPDLEVYQYAVETFIKRY